MICAHSLFREPSPAPATSKNKWVSAFKSVRGKADTVRWVGQGVALHIHKLWMVRSRSRSRVRAGQPPHKQKQLLKTLSSSHLDRDPATSSSSSTPSTLVTAEQEKVPGVQHHHHHLTVETAARCSASGEHSQIML